MVRMDHNGYPGDGATHTRQTRPLPFPGDRGNSPSTRKGKSMKPLNQRFFPVGSTVTFTWALQRVGTTTVEKDSAKSWSGSAPLLLLRRVPFSLLLLLLMGAWFGATTVFEGIVRTHRLRGSGAQFRNKILRGTGKATCSGTVEACNSEQYLKGARIALFAVPLAFDSGHMQLYRTALRSWLALHEPTPHVFFIGGAAELAPLVQEDPSHVHVSDDVDTNMEGVPQLHSVFARAAAASSHADIIILVDPTVVLFPDVLAGAAKLDSRFPSWAAAGASWTLPQQRQDELATQLHLVLQRGTGSGWDVRAPTGRKGRRVLSQLARLVPDSGGVLEAARNESVASLSAFGFLMWRTTKRPLLPVPVPPFALGRGSYDEWLVHQLAVASLAAQPHKGARQLVDLSASVTSVRLRAVTAGSADVMSKGHMSPKVWEFFANSHLAAGTGNFQEGGSVLGHAPWALMPCLGPRTAPTMRNQQNLNQEPSASAPPQHQQLPTLCLIPRVRPGNCSCEQSPYVSNSTADVTALGSYYLTCGRPAKVRFDYSIDPSPSHTPGGAVPGLPHTLEQLLPKRADAQRLVVIVSASGPETTLALNSACRLQQLGIRNFLLAALDADVYRTAFTQGLPVFFAASVRNGTVTGSNRPGQTSTGTSETSLQYLKLQTVLAAVRLGYSVLHADAGTVWFQNPLQHLSSMAQGTLLLQSPKDEGSNHVSTNFFVAWAHDKVARALERIVAEEFRQEFESAPAAVHAILCARNGSIKVGSNKCLWRDGGLEVRFLEGKEYASPQLKAIWNSRNVVHACRQLGCKILPNVGATDIKSQEVRLRATGLSSYDPSSRMCRRSWQSKDEL